MLYRLVSRLAHRAPLPHGKLHSSISGRRGAAQRWVRWASTHHTRKHTVWVHAASVGEYLTAEPVVRRLRHIDGVGPIVCSFSSPSMADWPDGNWANVVDYIPLDERRPIERALRAVTPSLIIFSRGDLWPEFVHGAKRLGIPLAVIGGTRGRASKLHWLPKRSAARSMFTQLDWVGTNTRQDSERWRLAGTPESVIEVTGDPRHDQILERTMGWENVRELEAWCAAGPLLVAGSTDHDDEQRLITSFLRILSDHPSARLIIVPHECSLDHARRFGTELNAARVSHQLWNGGAVNKAMQCLVVTKMGVLADLYAFANLAYVGGGFQRSGLHAVAEPAAYAVPVITGPRFRDSADAERMVEAGGAVALPSGNHTDALVSQWKNWIENANERWSCGLSARKIMQEGAADRTVQALVRLVPTLLDAGKSA